jgi:hypothetical protein
MNSNGRILDVLREHRCSCRYYEVGEPYICPMHFHATRVTSPGVTP